MNNLLIQRLCAGVFAVIIASAIETDAVPVPSFDLSNLVEHSDLIAVGKLESVQALERTSQNVAGNQATVQKFEGDLQLQAVYKGDASAGAHLSVVYAVPEEPLNTGYSDPQKLATRLYFLKKVTTNAVEFTSHYYPDFPVLESRPTLGRQNDVRTAIESELIQNIALGDDRLAQRSLEALWPTKDAVSVCKVKLTQHPSLSLRGSLTAYLLRAGDVDSIGTAAEVMKEAHQNAPHVLYRVAGSIPSISSKLSIQHLRSFLAIQDPSVERAVAEAVRDNGRAEFAPVAIDLLDTVEDKQTQYDLIVYFSKLRGIPGPGWNEFMSDPKKFVAEFSEWWAEKGKAEFGSTP